MSGILGYEFRNPALLAEALTTPSCKMVEPDIADNQRLEFLGDAVLGLMAADELYARSPEKREGDLTILRARMVSTTSLCEAAARINLVPMLKRNRGAGPLPPDAKTIADAVEALIGAAWLDGGILAARRVFDALGIAATNSEPVNPKGELQIRAQALHPPRKPVYQLLSTAGKSHEPIFTVRVSVAGHGEAVASAHSRKQAEARAAAALLAQT